MQVFILGRLFGTFHNFLQREGGERRGPPPNDKHDRGNDDKGNAITTRGTTHGMGLGSRLPAGSQDSLNIMDHEDIEGVHV